MNVKKLSKLVAAAALAGLSSVGASAATICVSCEYLGEDTYLGAYNSLANDKNTFANSFVAAGASITNTYVFDFAPSGSTAIQAGFAGTGDFTSFKVSLYSVTSFGTCGPLALASGNLAGALCSVNPVLSAISIITVDGINFANSAAINYTPLVAGRYAFRVVATAGIGFDTNYSGNLQTRNVPEPGSLALVGLALCGLGVTLRKSKAA